MIRVRMEKTARFIQAMLPCFVIILWIDAYVWLIREERYRAFLQPKLFPLLIIGISILLLFLLSFMFKGDHGINPGSSRGAWMRAAVLCLPILFLYNTYGKSLGVDALSKRKFDVSAGIRVSNGATGDPQSNGRFEQSVTLLDLVRNPDQVEGRHVITTGGVYQGSDIPEGYFMLFQFAVTCCAADAQPIWVLVKAQIEAPLENESWVNVEGRVIHEQFKENRVPVIEANSVHPIPTPPVEQRYLYF